MRGGESSFGGGVDAGLLPLLQGRLEPAFNFVVLHNLFKSEARFLDIDLKLKLVVVGEEGFMLKPDSPVLLVLGNIWLHIDYVLSDVILFILLSLVHLIQKFSFAGLVEARHVEVQRALRDHHRVHPVHALEVGLDGEFVLVELLLS